jgi:hypothetical protein
MWNASEKKLFLPITLYDRDDNYRNKDYFQGLSTLSIDLDSGITENYRITHIDTT